MWCYRKLIGIFWIDKIIDEKVLKLSTKSLLTSRVFRMFYVEKNITAKDNKERFKEHTNVGRRIFGWRTCISGVMAAQRKNKIAMVIDNLQEREEHCGRRFFFAINCIETFSSRSSFSAGWYWSFDFRFHLVLFLSTFAKTLPKSWDGRRKWSNTTENK